MIVSSTPSARAPGSPETRRQLRRARRALRDRDRGTARAPQLGPRRRRRAGDRARRVPRLDGRRLYEEISYDDEGNISGGSFLDYYVPTALETPKWETDKTITPSPHHPLGAKGVGESATVGAPPAIANAVVDALRHLGVTHLDIPITPEKVWTILKNKGVAE